MKKATALLLCIMLTIALCGCSAGESRAKSAATSTEAPMSSESIKTLVAYFSWSGNTAAMAQQIAELTDGDLFEILPQNDYPTDYDECTEVALAERDNNERPAIKGLPESLDGYERVFIGYPIWWHTAPMIIGSFLQAYELEGVEIYPFTQSASMNAEQFDNSMQFVRDCAPNAAVRDGLFVRSTDADAVAEYVAAALQ